MFRGFRRLLTGVMATIIILSFSLVLVEAKSIETEKADEEIIQVKFDYIDLFKNSFEIEDDGKASFSTILWARNVDEVQLYGYLQRYSNGTWKTIKSWSNETEGTEGILASNWYVKSGYSYRFISYAYLYEDGRFVESTSYTSENVYY